MTDIVEVITDEVLVVEADDGDIIVYEEMEIQIISQAEQGLPGPGIYPSTDPDNRISVGTDGGLYAPDMIVDPLAYYILARS